MLSQFIFSLSRFTVFLFFPFIQTYCDVFGAEGSSVRGASQLREFSEESKSAQEVIGSER
jgi:hypothetical protein